MFVLPDGHVHVYAPAVVANLPYDILRDFTPVTLVGTSPMVLFTGPDVTDFKSFLKSVSNPKGGPSAMANSGTGSISHLVGELFSQETKVKFNMAAPIVDRTGATIAALNISGQANRTPPRQMQETMLPALRAAAREVSQRLGQG